MTNFSDPHSEQSSADLNQPVRTVKGERGFEFDAHITFARPHTAAEVGQLLRGFGLIIEPYGSAEVRGARLTGKADLSLALAQIRALLESGEASRIEAGLRGFLRSATGNMDWVPWRKNVVLPRQDWEKVTFEEGLRYVLE